MLGCEAMLPYYKVLAIFFCYASCTKKKKYFERSNFCRCFLVFW